MHRFIPSMLGLIRISGLFGYIMGLRLNAPQAVSPEFPASFQVREIDLADTDEIEQITRVDPWHVSQAITEEHLAEGRRCAVAMQNGKVVAYHWMVVRSSYFDLHFNRVMDLAPNEAYCYRAVTIPAFSNRGVIRNLTYWHTGVAFRQYGKRVFHAVVLHHNRASRKVLGNMGFRPVGLTGCISRGKNRCVYLFCGKAFNREKRPLFFHRL